MASEEYRESKWKEGFSGWVDTESYNDFVLMICFHCFLSWTNSGVCFLGRCSGIVIGYGWVWMKIMEACRNEEIANELGMDTLGVDGNGRRYVLDARSPFTLMRDFYVLSDSRLVQWSSQPILTFFLCCFCVVHELSLALHHYCHFIVHKLCGVPVLG